MPKGNAMRIRSVSSVNSVFTLPFLLLRARAKWGIDKDGWADHLSGCRSF